MHKISDYYILRFFDYSIFSCEYYIWEKVKYQGINMANSVINFILSMKHAKYTQFKLGLPRNQQLSWSCRQWWNYSVISHFAFNERVNIIQQNIFPMYNKTIRPLRIIIIIIISVCSTTVIMKNVPETWVHVCKIWIIN